jgi:TRAP-type C4-dicarboxylate transport system substrate-binding protein
MGLKGLQKLFVALLGALALVMGFAPGEANAETIKIATLAPKQSVWGQVFQVWSEAVKKKSGEKLTLEFFYNGQQGDEGAVVGKMKAGQLDGAAITAVGLSKIHTPILALQLPGALTTWDKMEKAQGELKTDFEKGVKDAGFDLLGWGHVGRAHLFTKGDGEVKLPEHLKSRKPYMWREDKISPVFYQVIGATPVPLGVPEVLPQLKTGAIDTINAPALAVEQLQWGPQLNKVSEDVTGVAIGALVVSSAKMKALPGDLRTIMTDTGAIAAKALTDKIKNEDSAAYDRMAKKMTVTKSSAAEKEAWNKVFKETRKRLSQGTFSPDLVSKIEKAAGL